MFTDIHSFSLAIKAAADGVADLLREVYEDLGDIIVSCSGEIISYMGDSILAVFPTASENETVACALRMRQAFSGIVERRQLPSSMELEVGIGSGDLSVGVVGHRSSKQRDISGEEALQAATIGHHRGIAVTRAVHDRIQSHYRTNRLPDVEVKWRDDALEVWEVMEDDDSE